MRGNLVPYFNSCNLICTIIMGCLKVLGCITKCGTNQGPSYMSQAGDLSMSFKGDWQKSILGLHDNFVSPVYQDPGYHHARIMFTGPARLTGPALNFSSKHSGDQASPADVIMYQSIPNKITPPPTPHSGQTPVHLTFFKMFDQNQPLCGPVACSNAPLVRAEMSLWVGFSH